MAQQEFVQFVINTAHSKGIDNNKPFPFIVLGEVTGCTWHVVTGKAKRQGGGARHGQGHATNRTFTSTKTSGKVFGFYSAEEQAFGLGSYHENILILRDLSDKKGLNMAFK